MIWIKSLASCIGVRMAWLKEKPRQSGRGQLRFIAGGRYQPSWVPYATMSAPRIDFAQCLSAFNLMTINPSRFYCA
jgi:hypothetical protein